MSPIEMIEKVRSWAPQSMRGWHGTTQWFLEKNDVTYQPHMGRLAVRITLKRAGNTYEKIATEELNIRSLDDLNGRGYLRRRLESMVDEAIIDVLFNRLPALPRTPPSP